MEKLCEKCTAVDCALPERGAATKCAYFVCDCGPFECGHIDDNKYAARFRGLKTCGYYSEAKR